MTNGMKKEDVRILDFGCGNFLLGKYLQDEGYNVTGYDAFNEEYSRLPEKNKYHLCLCVEVLEHTSPGFIELDVIHRALVDGGLLYAETGFINICDQDKIELEDYVYISAIAGHATIFSHHGLDLLMYKKSFITRRHFDRNCRLYEKRKK
jgi:hypothetical protein